MKQPKLVTRVLAAVVVVQFVVGLVAVVVVAESEKGGKGEVEAAECELGTKAVLRCVSPSLAFIETPLGQGSGLLVEGGYVVTNAHVVDPYPAADITIGGARLERVPVKGVDLLADVALLGPIETGAPPAPLDNAPTVENGDDVYLVGFPGESDEKPEPTISRGVVSRTRSPERFGLTFLQTDAAIGAGQSGGALVNERGRIVGMSGLAFAEEFALALAANDVAGSARRIAEGDTPAHRPFPMTGGATSGTVEFTEVVDAHVLAIPPSGDERTIRITADPDASVGIEVVDANGELYLLNQAAVDFYGALEGAGADEISEVEVDDPVAPGTYEFVIPEDVLAVAALTSAVPGQITYSTTAPVHLIVDDDDNRAVRVGDRLVQAIDSLEMVDTYRLELAKGQKVKIFAGSPHGDMSFMVVRPGQDLVDAELVDDSDVGLYGLDAEDEFTADEGGTHLLHVTTADVIAMGYVLEVSET